MEHRLVNLSIFLLKGDFSDLSEYLKEPMKLVRSTIKAQYNLSGEVFYSDSFHSIPKWKEYLEELSINPINISNNSSNKAIILARISGKVMAVTFGYGRSLMKEEVIERNFGLRVALNLINPMKMRSINASTIEDMVVNTQRQASYHTSQDEFGLNVDNDIVRGVTGEPEDSNYGRNISGKDSLVVSVNMSLDEIGEKLKMYLSAYFGDKYKTNGFEWIDNIKEVRDSEMKINLNSELAKSITSKNFVHMHFSPTDVIDWQRLIGFRIAGSVKSKLSEDDFAVNFELEKYLESIDKDVDILKKLKRDKVFAMMTDGSSYVISSIYSSIVFQVGFENHEYILCDGSWYKIDELYYKTVLEFIKKRVRVSEINLPKCPSNYNEGEYNKLAADSSPDYCLMDQKMLSVEHGPKKVESCDLFTNRKQFIHIKNKGQSSQLSHLFAQGKVSARCFLEDVEFRRQLHSYITGKLSEDTFKYLDKPNPNEYEVIFGIIDKKHEELTKLLPFFSMVNLMSTVRELDLMNFMSSVCLIKKDV